jgi:hypothetical protein
VLILLVRVHLVLKLSTLDPKRFAALAPLEVTAPYKMQQGYAPNVLLVDILLHMDFRHAKLVQRISMPMLLVLLLAWNALDLQALPKQVRQACWIVRFKYAPRGNPYQM